MAGTRGDGGRGLHRVVVYGEPSQLVRTVGESSTAALDRGGALVLVATRAHLSAVDEWIRLSGSAPTADRGPTPAPTSPRDARYRAFDADELVGAFARDADPGDAFERFVCTACEEFPPDVEAVHVYGDLAGTLWERGQVQLAFEIEEATDRLAAERGLSVLCAYPTSVLSDPWHLDAIRRFHTDVAPGSTGPPGAADPPGPTAEGVTRDGGGPSVVVRTKVFPASPPACRAARQFVRAAMEDAGVGADVADAAELICSELATNAVRHARSAFTVQVDCADQRVRIAVGDEAQAAPVAPGTGPAPFPVRAARGLGIVSALADDWGVGARPPGKTVWAELRGSGERRSLTGRPSLS